MKPRQSSELPVVSFRITMQCRLLQMKSETVTIQIVEYSKRRKNQSYSKRRKNFTAAIIFRL